MAAQTITAHGVSVDMPSDWSGRVYRELLTPPEVMGPIGHFGSFPIPMNDTGFAGQMMGQVTAGRVACVYLEYVPDRVIQPGAGLYAASGLPAPFKLADFEAATLQVRRTGQAGVQRFFSVGRRPIVLYAVIATGTGAGQAVEALNGMLAGFKLASSPEASDYAVAARQLA